MGTDVHGGFQRRKDDSSKWEPVKTEWEMNRDYQLFAVLANVRNGRGFAGVVTGAPVIPIADERGLPDDLVLTKGPYGEEGGSDYAPELYNKWYGRLDNETELGEWMGYHSFTHMDIDEIINYPHWGEPQINIGVVKLEVYREYEKTGKTPNSWCGMISGGDVDVAMSPKEITDDTTHVRFEWSDGTLADRLDYFLDEVKRIRKENEGYQVRLVLGFDS